MSYASAVTPDVRGHQRPRVCHVPSGASSGTGEVALEVARLAGLFLDPWQEYVLVNSLAERGDGKWAAFEVGLVVPRQNGKGSILEARELAGLFAIDEERLLIHSAHEQATSTEHFRRLLNLIESCPDFDEQVEKAPKGKGMEAIELKNGSRILFKTRTGGGGRGFTGDLVVLDEAMILPESFTGALVPTMAARSIDGNPQLWYAGSAVDQQDHDYGLVLARVRDRGFKQAPRLMYAEWSAPGDDPAHVPEAVRSDPEVWAQANPGLGIRISVEHVANEYAGALGPRQFAVERLGVGDWPNPDPGARQQIAPEVWQDCADEDSEMARVECIAFDVKPDRSKTAVGVAGRRADGNQHMELAKHDRGTGWVVDKLVDMAREHRVAILLDGASPAAALETALRNALAEARVGVEVKVLTAKEHAQACGLLFDACEQRTVRHISQEPLDDALRGAEQRPLGEAWAWSRKNSSVDISPLVACTLALWGAHSQVPAAPARFINLSEV